VRIDATPINPSDLGLMLAGADMSAAKVSGSADDPVVTAPIPPAALSSLTAYAENRHGVRWTRPAVADGIEGRDPGAKQRLVGSDMAGGSGTSAARSRPSGGTVFRP